MFNVSICILLTALWKSLQIMTIAICCSTNTNNTPTMLLVPGWSIFFLCSSLSFALLCTFGIYTYPSSISYPFGVSLLFGIVALMVFIASTFGFYRYCGCCRVLMRVWKETSFYVCIGCVLWDIVSDILAATKVYVHHDIRFFTISVVFSSITFLLYWVIGLVVARNDPKTFYRDILRKKEEEIEVFQKYWEWTLYVPVLSMVTVTVYFPGSLLLELGLLFFLPILLLEIIHFCPILFEYYMYHGISYHDLVVYMLCFNLPKLLFVGIKYGMP